MWSYERKNICQAFVCVCTILLLVFFIFVATQLSGDKFGNNYDFSSCLPSVVDWVKCATHLLLIKEWQEKTNYVFNRSCSFIGGKWSKNDNLRCLKMAATILSSLLFSKVTIFMFLVLLKRTPYINAFTHWVVTEEGKIQSQVNPFDYEI